MYAFITLIIIIICILIILVVLVQNPKGGGLGAGFGGGGASNAMGGVQRTTDFLEKATWGLVIALLALSIISTAVIDRSGSTNIGDQDTFERIEE